MRTKEWITVTLCSSFLAVGCGGLPEEAQDSPSTAVSTQEAITCSPSTTPLSGIVYDIDLNGTVDALTDGLLINRFLFGFTGPSLAEGAVAPDCTLCRGRGIMTRLNQISCETTALDVDDNGESDALTDGLLIIRHMFGFTGDALVDGAVASDCGRCDAAAIEAFLEQNSTAP